MEDKETGEPSLIDRLNKAFGPLVGPIILDVVDLATFGPLGIGGFFIGAIVGWWMLSVYGLSMNTRLVLSLLAGIYCMIPLTEFVPAATLISAIARYMQGSNNK